MAGAHDEELLVAEEILREGLFAAASFNVYSSSKQRPSEKYGKEISRSSVAL